MNVQLIAYTENPEKIIACAGKLCYSPVGLDDLYDGLTDESAAGFVDMLSGLGHTSTTEHVSFTFAIEGVSRAFLAQVTRHRIASYSVQSQRYVSEKDFEFVTPPEIKADPKAEEIFLKAMRQDAENYNSLTEILRAKHYKTYIAQGLTEKQAESKAHKQAIEDARFVLPNACDTKMLMTINARSLMNFFHHRCCNRAQWEIRAVADEMLRLVYQIAPSLFKNAGPGCVGGKCPEGKMSCGKQEQVRKHYSDLKKNRD